MSTKTEQRMQLSPRVSVDALTAAVLPLENGDRLTRAEFERRYQAMPQIKKAELLEGVVAMGSPVHHAAHGKPHASLIGWIIAYCAATPGVDYSDNPTVRLDADNEVQPDALLRIEPAVGGRSRVSNDDYIEGAPELICEIAASSASYDLHDKRHIYRRCGVQEYLVWRVYDQAIDWWYLHEEQYVPLPANDDDVIASRVFPGLWLQRTALLNGDLAVVLATLQAGTACPEHQELIERLRISMGK
jgi:Uma2 family endonuclease